MPDATVSEPQKTSLKTPTALTNETETGTRWPAASDYDTVRIHELFVASRFDECLALIESLYENDLYINEEALLMKALIRRREGNLAEAVKLMQNALSINPRNTKTLLELAKSFMFLGKFQNALEALSDAEKDLDGESNTWFLYHTRGHCYMLMKDDTRAIENLQMALGSHRHVSTYFLLGSIYERLQQTDSAIATYRELLEVAPGHPDALVSLSSLLLQSSSSHPEAFDCFGRAFAKDPQHIDAVMGLAAMMQQNEDDAAALVKYRLIAAQTQTSSPFWNNIGMCLYSKQKIPSAVACLKRALYLAPFEWKIFYNLGLVHLSNNQYVSARYYLSAALTLNPECHEAIPLLGTCWFHLNDLEQARVCFDQAIALNPDNLVVQFNYAVGLFRHGLIEEALNQLSLIRNQVTETTEKEFLSSLETLEKSLLDAPKN